MEDAKATLPWNSEPQKLAQQTKLDQRGAKSECERALAEAETVLRELLLVEARQSNLEPSSAVNEKSRDPTRRWVMPRSLPSAVDRLRLDPGLDFIARDKGLIEMTEAGVRRMVQAHSAGLEVVIGINGREVLRFLAPKRGLDEPAASGRPVLEQSLKFADLTDAIARHTQPVTELLKAEESTEVALQMIGKERKRHEIESMLPWHATGALSDSDAERVEQALAEDAVLAQRYELVLEEMAAAIQLNDTLGSPSERAMDKLFAAIDAEETRLPRGCLRSGPIAGQSSGCAKSTATSVRQTYGASTSSGSWRPELGSRGQPTHFGWCCG
jgi:hypothetical protein